MKNRLEAHGQIRKLSFDIGIGVLAVALLLSLASGARFASTRLGTDSKTVQEREDPNLQLLEDVWQKVLAVVPAPPALPWPPKLHVLNEQDARALKALTGEELAGAPNAFATICADRRVPFCGGPVVCVNEALLEKVVEGNPNRLAFILGHELSHLTLGHVKTNAKAPTGLLQVVFTREKELAADKEGIKVALEAGYSLHEGLGAGRRLIEIGLEYPPLWPVDHPSWTQRLALLDKERSGLWRQMGAFNNGVVFLNVEQYASAARCFEAVIKEFPDCYEAQADLGYARLMEYCDLLTEDDIRAFNIGQIMIGGFYARPDTLIEKGRGKNKDLWEQAVSALQEALRLKPDLALAKANLGIAYLIHPDNQDLEAAGRYLQEAEALTRRSAKPVTRAFVLVNLAVAQLASGKTDLSQRSLDLAVSLAGDRPAVRSTVSYNRAMAQLRQGGPVAKRSATTSLANFLQETSPASVWWKLGFDQFSQLCSEQKLSCITREQALASVESPFRSIPSVNSGGKNIQLGDSMNQVERQLGETTAVPVVRGSNLKRLYYPSRGLEIIGDNEVLAISLRGRTAPALELQHSGTGGGKVAVRVGMTDRSFSQVLGSRFETTTTFSAATPYRFYPTVGLAARVAQGVVTELLVVIVPRRG
jgi:predicted Zn-dependent protease